MSIPSPRPAARKLLIQMSGAPGSGKSTVARMLRPSIGGIIIDHDVLRSCLLSSAILPFEQAAKQAYILQWKIAEDFMNQDIDSIIVDSTCNYSEVLKQGMSLAVQYGYSYWYVECNTGDIDLLDQRLRARTPMASQRSAIDCPPTAALTGGSHKLEDPRALFTEWMEYPCRPETTDQVIILNSTVKPAMLCEQILKRISDYHV